MVVKEMNGGKVICLIGSSIVVGDTESQTDCVHSNLGSEAYPEASYFIFPYLSVSTYKGIILQPHESVVRIK